MASRRTISYIGLWALIMPWLGFSWQTKTVLFSLTGLLLLFIGNRQYHNEKKKQKLHTHPAPAVHNDIEPVQKIQTAPVHFAHASIKESFSTVDGLRSFDTGADIQNSISTEIPKTRVRRKVEMAPRARKISVKSTHIDSPVYTNTNETDFESSL